MVLETRSCSTRFVISEMGITNHESQIPNARLADERLKQRMLRISTLIKGTVLEFHETALVLTSIQSLDRPFDLASKRAFLSLNL